MSDNTDQSLGDLFPDLGQETRLFRRGARQQRVPRHRARRDRRTGMAGRVFTRLAELGVNVDMIVQAGASTGTADISFTIPGSDAARVETALTAAQDTLGYNYKSFDVNPNVGKVAVVGVGMKTHSGLAARFFQALSEEGINVLMISTSEIRIAALVPLSQLNDAVRALHSAYGLDADKVEAVVYGGTGR
ncbi:Aspartokinase [Bifidobacterium animalis subsp. animalis IM386]|uniref:aspartate kinase n=1 Tax=Bifidobacterium animalis subsp. animalis IM386 TaxID=1402194 RepID=A0AAV2W106_9BIFI|nr:Aspartokinase [Bifidobacterium animalis subsp. animalis IM386]